LADDQTFHDEIEGYCSPLSYLPGERVALRVSTRADRYHVRVERWGETRDLAWSADDLVGSYVAPPVGADSAGCGWPESVQVPIGLEWRSGFYLVTLTAEGAPDGRDVAHACFVVRGRPQQPRRALYVLETNTWNAYNTWGGCSLYTGGATVSFDRPFGRGMLCRPEVDRDDRKARPVRWGEEPDADGLIFQAYRTANDYPAAIGSTGWFSHGRRFVEWAEAAGYEFDYAISTDLDDGAQSLDGYDLVISVGHDEYWSAGQRAAVERHVELGGAFVSCSGNTMFWQVRIDRDGEATNMVGHKYRAHLDDPVIADGQPELMSGMWADPVVGRPEWTFLGAGSAFGLYHRFGNATARGVGGFVVYRPEHWIMSGTGLGYGDVIGGADGVVGYETVGCPIQFDDFQQPVPVDRPDLPPGLEIVGHVPSSNLGVGEYPASISAIDDQGDLEFIAERIHGADNETNRRRVRNGNALMLTCRPFGDAGGEVVTIGTTDWVFGLAGDPAVARVTANALDRFMG
jgi:hypothetical protein